MKHVLRTALLLAWVIPGAGAQQSEKAISAGPGPAPSTNYVWVVVNSNTGTNPDSVMIQNPNGTPVLDPATGLAVRLTGLPYGFSQPYDIVASPLHHKVFVSNQGSGILSVIDTDTLQPLAKVTMPQCTTGRGLSMSADETQVYVAGATANGPAVWEVDTVTHSPGPGPIGGTADVTHVAEDCVVIRRGNAGGSGNSPGKVYFSVRNRGVASALPGFIGVINLITGAPVTTIPVESGTLSQVTQPTNMDRTPDHRFVFVACGKLLGVGDLRIIRIDPLTDAASEQIVTTAIDSTQNRVQDVSFTTVGAGINRGIIMDFEQQALGLQQVLREIDETGVSTAGPFPAAQGALTAPLSVRFIPLTKQMLVGDDVGTGNGYAIYDASGVPVSFVSAPTGVGSRSQAFAAMPTPGVTISDICPRGGAASAGPVLATVHGAGFLPGAKAQSLGTPILTTFVDSNTLTVDFAGLAVTTLDLQVTNPNFQSGLFGTYYRNYTAPGTAGSHNMMVQPFTQGGYQMVSIPQYATLTSLKAALVTAFGPYNPVLYRVFFYRGGRYVELNTMADDGCDLAGESFWIISRNGGTVLLTDPDVRLNSGGDSRVVALNPGFNMFSVPMTNGAGPTGTINWANVLVTTDQTDFGSAVSTSVSTALGPALEFTGSGYIVADPILAGQGYWVQNLTTTPAYLVFATTAVFKSAPPSAKAGSPPPPGMNPPPPPSGMMDSGSGSCGALGVEPLLLLALVRAGFPRRRRRRTLVA